MGCKSHGIPVQDRSAGNRAKSSCATQQRPMKRACLMMSMANLNLLAKSLLTGCPNWPSLLTHCGCKTGVRQHNTEQFSTLSAFGRSEPIDLQRTVMTRVMTLIRWMVGRANAMNAKSQTRLLLNTKGPHLWYVCQTRRPPPGGCGCQGKGFGNFAL